MIQQFCSPTSVMTVFSLLLLVVFLFLLPSLKLIVRPCKWMVGILLSFWDGLLSGAFAVSFRECLHISVSPAFRRNSGCPSIC